MAFKTLGGGTGTGMAAGMVGSGMRGVGTQQEADEQEKAAKAAELLKTSPYTDQDRAFLATLKSQGKTKEEAFAILDELKAEDAAKAEEQAGMSEASKQALEVSEETGLPVKELRGGKQRVVVKSKEELEQLPEEIQAGLKEDSRGFLGDVVAGFKEGTKEAEEGRKATEEAYYAGDIGIGRAFLENVGNAFNSMFGGVTGAVEEAVVEPILGTAGEVITAGVGEENVEKLKDTVAEKLAPVAEPVADFYNSLDDNTKRELGIAGDAVNNLFTLLGIVPAAKVGQVGTRTIKGVFDDVAPALVRQTDEGLDVLAAAAKVDEVTPEVKIKGAGILDSTNKMNPVKAEKFKAMTGQSAGEWLVERGIIANPDTTVKQLLDRFSSAKTALDDAVAKVGGTYKDKSISQSLDELADWYKTTGNRKQLSITNKRRKLLEDEGLTMPQIQQVKRELEKEVKMGYLKDNNSAKVERMTNLDSDLRDFYIATAKERGFENIRDLSLEIRDSMYLVNALGEKIARQLPNNLFSLTDNLLLVGGAINPQALAALGLKKVLSSGKVKAWLARRIAGEAKKADLPEVPTKKIELKTKQLETGGLSEEALKEATTPSP